jgi:hypothetical protein
VASFCLRPAVITWICPALVRVISGLP